MTTATEIRAAVGPPVDPWMPPMVAPSARPVVVAVDDSPAAGAAVRDGVRLAGDLAAPLVFVYVRRGPSTSLGEPYYQRRLDAEMQIGDRAIAASSCMGRPHGDSRSSPGCGRRSSSSSEPGAAGLPRACRAP